MVNQAEAAGHIAQASEHVETMTSLNSQVETDLSTGLNVLDKMDERLELVLTNVTSTVTPKVIAMDSSADQAYDNVLAADESSHFEESTNALQALTHVQESSEGAGAVLEEAKEALTIAISRVKEAKNALDAVFGHQSSEVKTSLGTAAENITQLGQRLNVG